MIIIKVLFTYDYGLEKMNQIKNLGYEIFIKKEKDLVVTDDIRDIDVLVCYDPFRTLKIENLNKLKWIQLSSIGIDQIPKQIILERNIIVTNNKGGYSIPIGEWIVLKILELLKNSKNFYNQQISRIWKIDTSVLELYGKTVSFIGTGSIAIEAAKRLRGFEVNIIGVNTSGNSVEYFDKCYSIDELDYVISISDIVIISLPYTNKTHNLINEDRLELFKKDSFLINISRGNIIDENSLIKTLKEGKIKGAALDVFKNEPIPKESVLWELENVIITPHNSWMSEMRNDRRFITIFDNLKRFKSGERLKNIIDLNKGY